MITSIVNITAPLVSEMFTRATLDALSAHIAILDVYGTIISVNKAWRNFAQENSAYSNKLLEGANYFQICNAVKGEDAQQAQTFANGIKEVIAGDKQEFTMESTCHSATKKHWFLSKVTRFHIADEIFLVVTNENITDRKLAEQALAKSELQLRSLVETNVIGVICWYLDGRITKANNAFLKMVGYTQEDLAAGKINWRDLTPPEYHELDEQAVKQLKEYRHCNPREKEYFCKNGSRVPVLIAGTMFFDSSDEGICYVLDLREQKMLQAQLIQAQKMESIGTLASGIAHDLNNILTPVLVFIQLLRRKLPEAKDLKIMNALETTIHRGSDLVRQILSLTRKTGTDSVKINFHNLLAEIELLLKETFPRSININIDMARDLATVTGNSTEVHQVILNLCINARDAMPNGGVLNIVVENIFIDEPYTLRNSDARVGEYVVIAISDTGNGIPISNIKRIFEPFFTTKGCERGTGLGLSIVLDIIKKHGGFITVNSNNELIEGSQFNIYLPVDKETKTKELTGIQKVFHTGKGEVILLVDDEVVLCEVTKSILEIYQYKVLTAIDGADAINTYKDNKDKIALVLMDLMMPNMDGFAASKILREVNPELKIMAITGLTSTGLAKEIKELDIPVLSKPFTPQHLLEKIYNILLD